MLLVQEFAVKVDQGFLLAVLSMFETIAADEEGHRLVAFHRDCEVVTHSLMDDMVHTTADTAKNFYDMLHFSPLKVCLHLHNRLPVEGGCVCFADVFFVFFVFFRPSKNMRQPFSGTAERISMKLLPKDRGECSLKRRAAAWRKSCRPLAKGEC